MDTNNNSENIFFLLNDDIETIQNNVTIQDLLDEFNMNLNNNVSYEKPVISIASSCSSSGSYKLLEDCTVSDLFKICDYYGLTKYIKMAKYKKNEIIHAILLFENDEQNNEIVQKRYKMWDYITELNKDKMMKKYIIWK